MGSVRRRRLLHLIRLPWRIARCLPGSRRGSHIADAPAPSEGADTAGSQGRRRGRRARASRSRGPKVDRETIRSHRYPRAPMEVRAGSPQIVGFTPGALKAAAYGARRRWSEIAAALDSDCNPFLQGGSRRSPPGCPGPKGDIMNTTTHIKRHWPETRRAEGGHGGRTRCRGRHVGHRNPYPFDCLAVHVEFVGPGQLVRARWLRWLPRIEVESPHVAPRTGDTEPSLVSAAL
jgi:hypothetical protein